MSEHFIETTQVYVDTQAWAMRVVLESKPDSELCFDRFGTLSFTLSVVTPQDLEMLGADLITFARAVAKERYGE